MKEFLKFKNLLFLSIFILLSSCGKTIDWDDDKEYITISFNSEGLTKVLSYKGLPFNGELVEYFDDEKTQLKERIDYKEGLKDGLSEEYNKNGQLEESVTYKEGEEEEEVKYTYHVNGQLFSKGTYKDGNLDGLYEEYYVNGQLFSKGTYKDGKEDGQWESYHENGQLRSRGTFKDGNEDGQWEYYDENGKITDRRILFEIIKDN
ncbi:hypothetical protein OAP98_00235 [Flavobacteriaceae bacterium]|nr:hypothetical protein [Flavobacteriaceae bacterium]